MIRHVPSKDWNLRLRIMYALGLTKASDWLTCAPSLPACAARAMLMKADIMLLDEPTNHLDVKNVAWLEGYLVSLTNVTSMIVSHDSGFLDHVCTDIIHYEDRKLKRYRVRTGPLKHPCT